MQVLWFKRDLRLYDHAPLGEACLKGKVLPLYILEPALWQQPDLSKRQYLFLCDSIRCLQAQLAAYGATLCIRVGEACTVLHDLHHAHGITALYSHEETWNNWTYQRDKAVKQRLNTWGIPWYETQRNGVVRRLKTRDGWASAWYKHMAHPCVAIPAVIPAMTLDSHPLPPATALGLQSDGCRQRQKGGRHAALACLTSFLNKRGRGYSKNISSPLTATEGCSRLSPYLAFGSVSMREVFQAVTAQKEAVRAWPREQRLGWVGSLTALAGRLRWHCHFMQKLEDEPSLETHPMHPAYRGLRKPNPVFFTAWANGQTGYPFVDACMRSLMATGWLNFRMRAMLISMASYHLWLAWQDTARHLARLFIDYEPGIHYTQVQMQSGTTGMNAIRIYNPIKQSTDHDPDGVFIRQWVPELAALSTADIHTPWTLAKPPAGYPAPLVDEKTARQAAARQIYAVRRQEGHRETTARVLKKHGSRKKAAPQSKRAQQLSLPLHSLDDHV